MAGSSEQSKSIDAQEDFSSVTEVQRALLGEGGTPRSRTVRMTVSGIGHNGAVYRGCPTCRISERRGCGHTYGIAEWLFRLKLIVKDPSGELEVTAWETAKQILGMELDDFVVVHVRAESDTVLRRLVGSHWILSLSRQKSERGYYVRVERAESVTRKQLFAENSKTDAENRSMEAPRTPERMVVPAFNLAAGFTSQAEMASVSTGREWERLELKAGLRNPHFRKGLFLGFFAGLLTLCLLYIVAVDAHAIRWFCGITSVEA
ncbi:hypothetical protein R1sor_015203 [Riccia sorocarpa]|uniref:OB domain-containing protein n=1 Tax=Riccia sorocarpa TaxID=122646 RepID=A0ABD3HHT1_9MARC